MSLGACIIYNPHSGPKGRHVAWDRLLQGRNHVELLRISAPDDLRDIVAHALDEGFDPIIAAGGDGTISAVAEQLAGQDVTLGVVPMGTFNYFARRLGLPEDLEAALDVALEGGERKLSIAKVNNRVFLNNASLGAYADILQVREGIYDTWGRSRIAAYWSVIVAVSTLYRRLKMRVTVDGAPQQICSPMVFVSTSSYQLQEFDLAGAQEIENGRMAAFFAHDTGRLELVWRALKVFFRGADSQADYQMVCGKEITIETAHTLQTIAHDGEKERMQGPFHFKMHAHALRVRVRVQVDGRDSG